MSSSVLFWSLPSSQFHQNMEIQVVSAQSHRMLSRINGIWLCGGHKAARQGMWETWGKAGYVPGVALALNVVAASASSLSPFTSANPHPTTQHWVMSDSQGCWMLKESATAAGGRDKAPPYLHRLNSRINLSTPPLPPRCLSPPYLPPPPPFPLQHLPPYICTVVMMWEIAF